jgi:glyoxylase-like metal-dependent hydrolase (beta-lactamase superfamily II)
MAATRQRILDADVQVDWFGPLGPLANNLYLIIVPHQARAMAVDAPPETLDVVLPAVREQGLALELVVATHSHWDHVAEAGALADATGAAIVAHRLDAPDLAQPRPSALFPEIRVPSAPVAREVDDGDLLTLGPLEVHVWHTPGHTPGSICLYLPRQGLLFSGDTLFAGSYGRYDLPGGDPGRLMASLRRLAALPAPTMVLPGHGPPTTIGDETWLRRLGAAGG